jgi:hypothetical protein
VISCSQLALLATFCVFCDRLSPSNGHSEQSIACVTKVTKSITLTRTFEQRHPGRYIRRQFGKGGVQKKLSTVRLSHMENNFSEQSRTSVTITSHLHYMQPCLQLQRKCSLLVDRSSWLSASVEQSIEGTADEVGSLERIALMEIIGSSFAAGAAQLPATSYDSAHFS